MINDNQVEKIIKDAQPKVSQDEKFKGVLRAQVLQEAARAGFNNKLINVNFMKNMRMVFAGVAALAVVAIAVFVGIPKKNGNGVISMNTAAGNITRIGDNGFGKLDALSAGGKGGGTSANAPAPMAASTQNVSGTAPAGTSENSADSAKMMAPNIAIAPVPIPPGNYYQAKYVYKGDTFTQDQDKLDVLKHIVTPLSADQAVSALSQSDFGVNLSSFGSLKLQNVTIMEDKDFGHTINIDLTNGSFYIYQNYEKWPQDQNPRPLTQSDVPSDDAIIKIANQFMSDHSFAMGNYGSPVVMENNYYAYATDGGGVVTSNGGMTEIAPSAPIPSSLRPYFPDDATVLYPLMINGKNVYDPSGNKMGLNVNVNIRYNRVSNVSGVNSQNYQASSYTAITDVKKILDLTQNPPFYPIIYMDSMGGGTPSASGSANVKTTEVDLGTPTMGYTQMYNYVNGQGSEFLVPALIFPVTNSNNGYTSVRNVVVPLIQDFIQNTYPGGKVVPLSGTATPPPTPAVAPATGK